MLWLIKFAAYLYIKYAYINLLFDFRKYQWNGFLFRGPFLSIMAWVMWFTGLPGCGKTTIADKVLTILSEKGISARILQLDEIRRAITPKPKYTEEERDIVYASLAYMGKLLADEGVNVIIDATANRRRYRDFARSLIPNFAEVFIRAPLSVCMEREAKRKAKFSPKDIYKKAAGEKAAVPGVNVAYEEPLAPEIEVDTSSMGLEESVGHIADKIQDIYAPKR
jgi:adenylylsulfate kinase